jgi:hypothetical protein
VAEGSASKPDVYATCCPDDGRILDYYADTFDAVYVALNPFIKPVSISPELFHSGTYPDRRTIIASCEPIRWNDILTATGLPSISAVDIGLRTMILGLKKEYENKEYAKRIDALKSVGIFPPGEGEHPDTLHDQVLGFFQELGHESVWVGDEWGEERELYSIQSLKSGSEPAIVGHRNVFSPDKSILWTVHWDSHFSLLCSSREILNQLGVAERLEGFYCNRHTQIYWSVHGA